MKSNNMLIVSRVYETAGVFVPVITFAAKGKQPVSQVYPAQTSRVAAELARGMIHDNAEHTVNRIIKGG